MSPTRYSPDNDHRFPLPASSSGSAHRAIDNGWTSSAIDRSEQPNHRAINPRGYRTDAIPHHPAANNVRNNGAGPFIVPNFPTNNGYPSDYGSYAAPTLYHPYHDRYNYQGSNSFGGYESDEIGQGTAEQDARVLFREQNQANPHDPNDYYGSIPDPPPAAYHATLLPSSEDFSPNNRTFSVSIATSQANVTDNRNVTVSEPSSATLLGISNMLSVVSVFE